MCCDHDQDSDRDHDLLQSMNIDVFVWVSSVLWGNFQMFEVMVTVTVTDTVTVMVTVYLF